MKVSPCVFVGFSETWSWPCVFFGFLETWSRLEENRVCIIGFYHFMYYRVLEKKKNQNFCFFFFLNNADVENCGASRGFGFIDI